MPRGPRLDAPGTLHHVMMRGIERIRIVMDDKDRKDLMDRMGDLAVETSTAIYAWALLDNHVHILLRSDSCGLPAYMRCLLTGYAISFNRRTAGTPTFFKTDTNRLSVRKIRISGSWLGISISIP